MTARIAYSCVIDNTPKLLWEGAVFTRSITAIAGIPGDDVTVHFTPDVHQSVRTLIAGTCRTAEIAAFDLGTGYTNKIGQLARAWPDVDAVAFLDADMIVLTALSPDDIADGIAGVPVFGPNLDETTLKTLYRGVGPARAGDWIGLPGLAGEPFTSHRNHLNGGLYLVPQKLIRLFGDAWRAEAGRLLADPSARHGAQRAYCDQIAAGVALARLGLRAHHLPVSRNAPPPIARSSSVSIIHDFAKFAVEDRDGDGHLRLAPQIAAAPERRALRAIIDDVNDSLIGQPFRAYRRFRYALYEEEFGEAARQIGAIERGNCRFPDTAADMRVHLAAYRRMTSERLSRSGSVCPST